MPAQLAMLAAAALPAIASGISGTMNILGDQKYQRRNKQQLEGLLAREASGDLGLGGEEKQALQNQLVTPVQSAAATARKRAEQIMASSGTGASGADLSRLRTEQTRATSQGAQQAAAQIAGLDLAAKQSQQQEIEQRLAQQAALRLRDYNIAGGLISKAAGPLGMLAGAPPGTMQLAGLFGSRFSQPEQDQILKFAQDNPDEFQALMKEIMAKMATSGGTATQGSSSASTAQTLAALSAGG